MSSSSTPERPPRLLNLSAELTYRCPLRCPYCSNPTNLADFPDALDAADWRRVFEEAAALGAVHVGLTGGEPSARADLAEIVAAADEAGLYSHLVTAGLPLDAAGLGVLHEAGLCSVQISVQDAEAEASDARAETMPGCAHLPCLERPAAFNALLAGFLKGHVPHA